MSRRQIGRASCMGVGLILSILSGCASSGTRRTEIDVREEQVRELTERLSAQEEQLSTLNRKLSDMRQALKQSETAKKVSPLKPLSTIKLKPGVQSKEITDEDDGEIDSSETQDVGEKLADSSHEPMHWYYEGLSRYRSQDFDGAVQYFHSFLKEAPNHIYADRAEYWIAESHFRNQEYPLAVAATHRLESKYPYSFKVPEAVWRRGESLLMAGSRDEARYSFRQLLMRFPDNPITEVAAKRLSELSPSSGSKNAQPLLLDD